LSARKRTWDAFPAMAGMSEVRAGEGSGFSLPYHEWTPTPGDDDPLRIVFGEDGNGECPLCFARGRYGRCEEIPVIVLLDQVGKYLGVGLGAKTVPG
jgi:hypothetical protein